MESLNVKQFIFNEGLVLELYREYFQTSDKEEVSPHLSQTRMCSKCQNFSNSDMKRMAIQTSQLSVHKHPAARLKGGEESLSGSPSTTASCIRDRNALRLGGAS